MDLYIVSLVVGGGGLLSMAAGGLDHHGGHGGHSHVGGDGASFGVGHHAAHGHGGSHAHGASHGADGAHAGHGAHAHEAGGTHATFQRGATWLLSAPRVLFSVLLGLGATGLAASAFLGGVAQAAVAAAGGVLFERFIITPIWNIAMKFESKPALTLESTLMDEATAVTNFDRNGEGIVSIELNGQIVQVLASLRSQDRIPGTGVRAGQRVRIEEVDPTRNRCTVSVL